MTNQKTKSRQKKVVVASLALAALTAVGGTFAWFTSHEDVTNKLTGVNDYGVSFVEDFTPPEDWTPGQDINKDVYVTNTGNVDAFVKVELTNSLDITTIAAGPDTTFRAVNQDKYYELSTVAVNPSMPDIEAKSKDEVKSKQAGGRVVCKANVAVATERETIKDGTNYNPATDDSVSAKNGLYVFEKDSTVVGGEIQYTYDGYWYQNGKYYAVDEITKTTAADGTVSFSAKLMTTSHVKGETPALDYSKVNNNLIVATYGTGDEKITINITLASDWRTNWTFDATNKVFYYNDTLKAGKTSAKLVDKVELDNSVKNEAYKDILWRLRLSLDSVQIVKNEAGQDTAEAVLADEATWTMTPTISLDSEGVIKNISWS